MQPTLLITSLGSPSSPPLTKFSPYSVGMIHEWFLILDELNAAV
jgi:hypothetical protein